MGSEDWDLESFHFLDEVPTSSEFQSALTETVNGPRLDLQTAKLLFRYGVADMTYLFRFSINSAEDMAMILEPREFLKHKTQLAKLSRYGDYIRNNLVNKTGQVEWDRYDNAAREFHTRTHRRRINAPFVHVARLLTRETDQSSDNDQAVLGHQEGTEPDVDHTASHGKGDQHMPQVGNDAKETIRSSKFAFYPLMPESLQVMDHHYRGDKSDDKQTKFHPEIRPLERDRPVSTSPLYTKLVALTVDGGTDPRVSRSRKKFFADHKDALSRNSGGDNSTLDTTGSKSIGTPSQYRTKANLSRKTKNMDEAEYNQDSETDEEDAKELQEVLRTYHSTVSVMDRAMDTCVEGWDVVGETERKANVTGFDDVAKRYGSDDIAERYLPTMAAPTIFELPHGVKLQEGHRGIDGQPGQQFIIAPATTEQDKTTAVTNDDTFSDAVDVLQDRGDKAINAPNDHGTDLYCFDLSDDVTNMPDTSTTCETAYGRTENGSVQVETENDPVQAENSCATMDSDEPSSPIDIPEEGGDKGILLAQNEDKDAVPGLVTNESQDSESEQVAEEEDEFHDCEGAEEEDEFHDALWIPDDMEETVLTMETGESRTLMTTFGNDTGMDPDQVDDGTDVSRKTVIDGTSHLAMACDAPHREPQVTRFLPYLSKEEFYNAVTHQLEPPVTSIDLWSESFEKALFFDQYGEASCNEEKTRIRTRCRQERWRLSRMHDAYLRFRGGHQPQCGSKTHSRCGY